MVEVICKLPVENVSFIMSPMTRRDPGVVRNSISNRQDYRRKRSSIQLAWIVLTIPRKLLTILLKRDRNGYQLNKNICGRQYSSGA